MSKKIIFSFDGTCNEPEDGRQSTGWLTGEPSDDNVTNVIKLHLLLGGDFEGKSHFKNQVCRYYSGVGTYGNKFKRLFNTVFAPENKDVGAIINTGMDDLKKLYKPGDKLYLFGFSRGAAIARVFAARLKDYFPDDTPEVEFMGVFDTVAAFNKPNLDDHNKPVSDVIFKNGTISKTVKQAVHLLAIDEKRIAFQPTLMNRKESGEIIEIWFAGAHSDVGGGYRYDGLSDNALQFMINEILNPERKLGLKVLSPVQIDYDNLSKDEDVDIDYEDIIIQPNPFGVNHQQERPPLLSRITLSNRQVRINENDKPTDRPPIIHPSVVRRIHRDKDYKPASLRRLLHRLWSETKQSAVYKGYSEHKMLGVSVVKPMQPGEEQEVTVYANTKHNYSGILLEAGAKYQFNVPAKQLWFDSGVATNAKGWDRDDVELGMREFFIKLAEGKRRHPDAKWFELIGRLGKYGEVFRVLKHTTQKTVYEAREDAELVTFANDLNRFYDNNLGSIKFTIRRIA